MGAMNRPRPTTPAGSDERPGSLPEATRPTLTGVRAALARAWREQRGALVSLVAGCVILAASAGIWIWTARWCSRDITCIPAHMIVVVPLIPLALALIGLGGLALARGPRSADPDAIDPVRLMSSRGSGGGADS